MSRRSRLLLCGWLAAGCLFAADPVTRTDRLDFPAGGALKMVSSSGELTIEAWDQPGIEIVTTVKPLKDAPGADTVKITSERQGNDVVVTTVYPKRSRLLGVFVRDPDYDIDYHIRLPRAARLNIVHNTGEVHIEGVTGEIHATAYIGLIGVRLPRDGQYTIDAKAKLGSVESDFPGREKRQHWFGHALTAGPPTTTQKVSLRIGYGDLLLLAITSAHP